MYYPLHIQTQNMNAGCSVLLSTQLHQLQLPPISPSTTAATPQPAQYSVHRPIYSINTYNKTSKYLLSFMLPHVFLLSKGMII